MHKLLRRQIERRLGEGAAPPPECAALLAAVAAAYHAHDADRALLESAMELTSAELVERYERAAAALAESERERQRRAEAEALLEATLEATGDGVLVVDLRGRLLRWNQRFLTLWGLSEADVRERGGRVALGKALAMVEEPEAFLDAMRVANATPEQEFEDLVRLRDGRVFERVSRPTVQRGAHSGRVWTFRDVSRRVAMEQTLQRLQRLDAMGRLATGVAHDFNNVLAVIEGHAGLLIEDLQGQPEALADLHGVTEACRRGAALTRKVLAFARQQTIEPIHLPVREVVDGIVPMLRRLLGSRVALRVEADGCACEVRVDPGSIEQVLVNLVVNARDALGGEGTITLRLSHGAGPLALAAGARSARRWACVAVADDGPGIPADLLHRIFDPFFTTKGPGGGSGLGLAIAHTIAAQHGGALEVSSHPGQGATFSLWLPVATADQPDEAGAGG
jgi:two-component system cell cycle sensor histidine kinase/response regulator CckA